MMAGKRTATSELNHDNWDQEDEIEEAGTFKIAPQNVLQTRVIKTAKRRTTVQSGDDQGPNVFSSFTGFAKTPSSNSKPPTFSFLAQSKSELQTDVKNGISTTLTSSILSLKNEVTKPTTENTKSSEYYAKLKGLNESVSQWIKTHVDTNPICILTPIFKDYEKYLKEIEELNSNSAQTSTNVAKEVVKNSTSIQQKLTEKKDVVSSTQPTFTFGVQNTPESKPKTPTFSFDAQKVSTTENKSSLFSFKPTKPTEVDKTNEKNNKTEQSDKKSPFVTPFGNTAAFCFGNTQNSANFSFGTGKPFTFANVSAPQTEAPKEETDEADEPPKVEFTQVVEEGSTYNTKCKLFAKKDNEFVERGVGQLYLKPIEGSEKTQLIVRADTNLGNLLMNVVLSKSIPTSRKGKNHVMIICVPTPEEAAKCKSDQNPLQTLLIKVKNSDEADKLFEVIEKHKN